MANFPTITSGRVERLPFTRAKTYRTKVLQFANGSEQRWAQPAGPQKFSLNFNGVSTPDKDTVRAFFVSCKGAYDATWSLTVDGVQYDYCAFDQDDFTATQAENLKWSFSLKIVQTRKN